MGQFVRMAALAMGLWTIGTSAEAGDLFLLPQWDGGSDISGRFSLQADDDRVNVQGEVFAPLGVGRSGGFFVHGGLAYSRFDDAGFETDGGTAFLGMAVRRAVRSDLVIGANIYGDVALVEDAEDDVMAGLSLGVEMQYLRQPSTLTAGVNYYIPGDDFTDPDRLGGSGVALREGVDGYLRYDRSLTGPWIVGLQGGVYDYRETVFAEDEDGWRLEARLGRQEIGPWGTGLVASLGLRSDWNGETDVLGGLQIEVPLGRRSPSPVLSTRNLTGKASAASTAVADRPVAAPPPRRSRRLVPPVRQLAFGTPLIPVVQRSQHDDQNQNGADDGSGTSTAPTTGRIEITYSIATEVRAGPDQFDSGAAVFTASAAGLGASVPTVAGTTSAVAAPVVAPDVAPGSIAISLASLPSLQVSGSTGLQAESVLGDFDCTDRTNGGTTQSGTIPSISATALPASLAQITVTAGDDLVCEVSLSTRRSRR